MRRTSLTSRLPSIAAMLGPKIEAVVADAADDVARNAKQRVPVDTGKLRDAIHVEQDGPAGYRVIGGDGDAFYGHIVEHGSRNTPPRPFLVPALEEARGPAVQAMRRVLKDL